MNNEPLAPIFLDDKPVTLKDPKPQVSAVLSAAGQTAATEVRWLKARAATQGTLLRPDHALDRTSAPATPIYLTSQTRRDVPKDAAIGADARQHAEPVEGDADDAPQDPADGGQADAQPRQAADQDEDAGATASKPSA